MSYQQNNPYVTNLIPLFNVTTSPAGAAVSQNYSNSINQLQSLLNYSQQSLGITTIYPYGTNVTIESDLYLNGQLIINGFPLGPDTTGSNFYTGNSFLISTGTTSLVLNNVNIKDITQSSIVTSTIGIEFITNNIQALKFDGYANAYFNNDITCQQVFQLSDERLKENIQPMSNSLSTLLELNGVHYTMNNSYNSGFIAQQLHSVIPEAVNTKNSEKWSVDYSQIIPLLVESVKELHKEIEILKKKIS
jgi:hypothetical protein